MHWFLHILGIDGSSYWANFWDGFGSGPVAWCFLPLAYYIHHICHSEGCHRMGHPDLDGVVKCKRCIIIKKGKVNG
jgi:hypothetical protein